MPPWDITCGSSGESVAVALTSSGEPETVVRCAAHAPVGDRVYLPGKARADCESVTSSLTTFTRDPAVLEEVRERVAERLD